MKVDKIDAAAITEEDKFNIITIAMIADDEAKMGGQFLMLLALFPVNIYLLDILRDLYAEAAAVSHWEQHLDSINAGINLFPWLHIAVFSLTAIRFIRSHNERVMEINSCHNELKNRFQREYGPGFNKNTYLFSLGKLRFEITRRQKNA